MPLLKNTLYSGNTLFRYKQVMYAEIGDCWFQLLYIWMAKVRIIESHKQTFYFVVTKLSVNDYGNQVKGLDWCVLF